MPFIFFPFILVKYPLFIFLSHCVTSICFCPFHILALLSAVTGRSTQWHFPVTMGMFYCWFPCPVVQSPWPRLWRERLRAVFIKSSSATCLDGAKAHCLPRTAMLLWPYSVPMAVQHSPCLSDRGRCPRGRRKSLVLLGAVALSCTGRGLLGKSQ